MKAGEIGVTPGADDGPSWVRVAVSWATHSEASWLLGGYARWEITRSASRAIARSQLHLMAPLPSRMNSQ